MISNNGAPPELSDAQRELLRSAVQNGYFKTPREISTVELANKNEVSSREAPEKINRALDIVLQGVDLSD